jgi:hypothetical protein
VTEEQPEFLQTRVQRERERRADWRRTAMTAVVAGILGIVATSAGSFMQARSAIDSQQAQAAEARGKEDRDRKNGAYFAFLDAANGYAVATATIRVCLTDAAAVPGPITIDQCRPAVERLGEQRSKFASARSQVYVWGSPEANAVERRISAMLPTTEVDLDDVSSQLGDLSFDSDAFALAHQDFQRRLCVELPANPRDNC